MIVLKNGLYHFSIIVICPEHGLADGVSLGQDCSLGVGTVLSGFILLPDLSIQKLRVRMICTISQKVATLQPKLN